MKKIFTVLGISVLLAITGILLTYNTSSNEVHGSSSGSPAARTGSPGDGGQTCKTCHSGPAATAVPGLITSTIPSSGYVPGTTYQVTASIGGLGHSKFGFQVSPQNAAGALLGTLVNTSTQTQLVGTGKYVTHTTTGNQGVGGFKSWTFDWIAPNVGTGAVTFYGAFNVTNANSQSSGDTIYTSTLSVNESTVGIESLVSLSESVKVYPTLVSEFCNYSLSIKNPSEVDVQLYDASGKLLQKIISNEKLNSETKKLVDCSSLPSGFYFIHTLVNGQKDVRKIIVAK